MVIYIVRFLFLKQSCFSLELCVNWIITSWVAGVRVSCTSITNENTRDGVAVFRYTIPGAKYKDPLVADCGVRVKKQKCSSKMVKDTCAVACCVSAGSQSLPGALLLCSSAKFVSWSVVRLSQLMCVSAPVVAPLFAFTFNYKAAIQFGVYVE